MTISDLAKEEVGKVLKLGETAVDATMGNGWDALFLAETVGEEGRVFGFDVQAVAVESTRKKLVKAELLERCELLQRGHEEMAGVVPEGVGAVMFNLGYFPYGDKEVTTVGETTLLALEAGAELLREGGVLTVICYRGHPGGMEEAEKVWEWAGALEKRDGFSVNGPDGFSDSFPDGVKPFLLSLRKSGV